jgi:hypothetical protein
MTLQLVGKEVYVVGRVSTHWWLMPVGGVVSEGKA